MMTYDTIIHNGTVMTVNADFDIIADGVVCIKNDVIERVEARSGTDPLPAAAETVDAAGGLILPGLINCHTHLPMTLFRGLADDLPLDVWLNQYIFPAEGKYINPDSVKSGALLACAEMLLSGTTTCCDGYFLEAHVAEAVYQSGMRAVLGQGVIDFPAPGVPDPSKNVENAAAFIEKWRDISPLIRPSMFCHSPYTCSAETLKKAKKTAAEMGVLFQIHVAETRGESDNIRAEHGTTPVGYLDNLGLLDSRTLVVHAVWATEADVAVLANRHTPVVHNPESNMKLAAGIAPVADLIQAGVIVGLGTDGCASNNDLDLLREMDTAAKLHKVSTLDPTVMDARCVLEMATIKGAEAIGLGGIIGSLEKGKQADLIIMETGAPALTPLYHPASQIVYTADGSHVRDVMVSGKFLVRDRCLLTLDLENILDQMERLGQSIKAG